MKIEYKFHHNAFSIFVILIQFRAFRTDDNKVYVYFVILFYFK